MGLKTREEVSYGDAAKVAYEPDEQREYLLLRGG
jgi:hypothetical protein